MEIGSSDIITSSFIAREFFLFPSKDSASCSRVIRTLSNYDKENIPQHIDYYLPEYGAIFRLIRSPHDQLPTFALRSQIQRFGALLLIGQEYFSYHDMVSILNKYIDQYGLANFAMLPFVMRSAIDKLDNGKRSIVLTVLKNRQEEIISLGARELASLLIGLGISLGNISSNLYDNFLQGLYIENSKLEKIGWLYKNAFLLDFISRGDRPNQHMLDVVGMISQKLLTSVKRGLDQYLDQSTLNVFFHTLGKQYTSNRYDDAFREYKSTLRVYLLEILNFRFLPITTKRIPAFDVLFSYRKDLQELYDKDPLFILEDIDTTVDIDVVLDCLYSLHLSEFQRYIAKSHEYDDYTRRGIPHMTDRSARNLIDSYDLEHILANNKIIILPFNPFVYMVCFAKIQTHRGDFCRLNRNIVLTLGKMLLISSQTWSLPDDKITNFFQESICPIFAEEIQTFVHDLSILYYWLVRFNPKIIREKVDFFLDVWPQTFRMSYFLAVLTHLIENKKSTIRPGTNTYKYLMSFLDSPYTDRQEYEILLQSKDIEYLEQNPLDKLF